MCDRIVVLREGRKTAEFSRAEATQEKVLRAATDSGDPLLRLVPNATPAAALASASQSGSGLTALIARREFGLVAAMLAVIVPVAFINPLMFSSANLTALAMDAALLIDRGAGPDAGA